MDDLSRLGTYIPPQRDVGESTRDRQRVQDGLPDRSKKQDLAQETVIPNDNVLSVKISVARESMMNGRVPQRGSVLNILV